MKHLTVLLFWLLVSVATAQEFSMPMRVNSDAQGSAERSPSMTVARDGTIYISWVKATQAANGDMYLGRSTDGGATFTVIGPVLPGGEINSNYQRTPQLVVDPAGVLHTVWMENRFNNQPDVWYMRSADRGQTWTEPVSLSDDGFMYAQDFGAIAVDSTGRLYVSFLDSREEQRGESEYVHLYLTTSSNGGMTWTTPVKADILPEDKGGTCECCKQDIAVSPEGHIYIAFRSNIDNRRDIWVARSTDGGVSFTTSVLIQSSPWHINACPVSGPNIALDHKENLHVVWRDKRDVAGKDMAYYARLPKGETATPANIPFNFIAAQAVNWPDVAVYGGGQSIAIVYQTSNSGLQYLVGSSVDQGLQEAEVAPANGSKEFGSVAFAPDGTRYLCWQDSRRDAGDIYFVKETSPLVTTAVPTGQSTDTDAALLWQNGTPYIRLNLNRSLTCSVTLYDIWGRQARTSVEQTILAAGEHMIPLDYQDWTAGVYIVRCELGTYIYMLPVAIRY